MPIPASAVAAAQSVQLQAAHDSRTSVRLIAGPGTGKSASIRQRIGWLLNNGQRADRIFAVSFTRASSQDLERNVKTFCTSIGHNDHAKVSTLHSLGLRTLKSAGLLTRFHVAPLILDGWETEHVFDAEFGESGPGANKKRRNEIRHYHEAYWSTGVHNPPNYIPPVPPISTAEDTAFGTFYLSRSALYCCVLPGEMIRQCVMEANAGSIDPASLLNIEHLIVDEFQDLNQMDQEFIDSIINGGAEIFIAGDDDQSIYSFRFANPAGIQNFPVKYPQTGLHTLNECFRCMPTIMNTANTLIAGFPSPQRVQKNMQALFRHSAPNAHGVVHRWRFADGRAEARAIAESCKALIDAGVQAVTILILLSNKRVLLSDLTLALEDAQVPFVPVDEESFHDTKPGRFVYALLRVVAKPDDYVAHRTILGIRNGVGTKTAHRIAEDVIANNLNYHDIFRNSLPTGVFTGRQLTALTGARDIFAQIADWDKADLLSLRLAKITELVELALGSSNATSWTQFVSAVPPEATLEELLGYIAVDTEEQRFAALTDIYSRLGQAAPIAQTYEPGVRIMTMHGAKGLEARVVFIPGLEDSTLPGQYRLPYQGLILEAARLLYVSVTRARAACILSFASRRLINGQTQAMQASRFNAHLAGPFLQRHNGLTADETQEILCECNEL